VKRVAIAVCVLAGVAHADEKLVPTAVAVSSTVDNANIKPDQLIDGKMTTAWNSVTGGQHEWVAVRVPVKAHVTAIKLTAGFTAIDKKLGDLFTENIRIKKVVVTRYGATLGEFPLDTNNRELQTLKVDGDGGDFKIYITETIPGSKKNWKEVSISELEVWGTPAPVDPAAPAVKPAPIIVKVGDLDADAMLTKAECKRALGPADNPIIDEKQIYVTDALTLCQRATQAKGDSHSLIAIGLADRRTKKLFTKLDDIDVNNGPSWAMQGEDTQDTDSGDVAIEMRPLTTTERVVVVTTTSGVSGPMTGDTNTRTQWYRASTKGLSKILEWTSSDMNGEESTRDICDPVPFTPGASIPKQIVFTCTHTTTDWHNENVSKQGSFDKARKERYKWNGSEYVKL
jgi:hypothetical protein